jgi:DNA-binding LacI/PurR family transcriptional regulator
MITQETHSAYVNALADRLITDIRRRGLTVGDRYLTTAEVSRMLGIRKAMAGKAMRHLAERGVLISRQRSGTFIGPGLGKQKRSKVRTVHVLLPASDPIGARWPFEPFIEGIRTALPEINVQFTFVPENDSVAYVQELIDSSRESGQFVGIVAMSCAPAVYRFLAELGVPAVVRGSLYSSDLPITSIDTDSFQSGRLLTDYLIGRGHRRIGLLMTRGGRPGDHAFMDGITDVLTAANLPPNALMLRPNYNSDLDALRATTRELLKRVDRPGAIITRGAVQAAEIAAAAAEMGLRVPENLEIAVDHPVQTSSDIDVKMFPRVVPKWSFVEVASTIGRLLKEITKDASSRPQRVVVPVEFCQPERGYSASDK